MNPHTTHDLPPLDELEHALERALAAWPTVQAAWVFASVAAALPRDRFVADRKEQRAAAHGPRSAVQPGDVVPRLASWPVARGM